MLTELLRIAEFIFESFLHIWPYLVITIPFAVFIRMTGRFSSIDKYLRKRPFISILIATALGAFSPFCSCGVIPVIASLLIGGVPLPPVMAFWLASPSMDPEMFFLSVSVLGWDIAVWRLGATFLMSFSGGYVTHILIKTGWLKGSLLRGKQSIPLRARLDSFRNKIQTAAAIVAPKKASLEAVTECCSVQLSTQDMNTGGGCSCSGNAEAEQIIPVKDENESFKIRFIKEAINSTTMVAKFMLLAFFLEALLILYVPSGMVVKLLGNQNPLAVLFAALIGIPVYTSNLTALPIVGALLAKGMSGGTGLAFLISGPTTTIPAMAAVWKLTVKKVFFVYLFMTLISAILAGYLFDLFV